MEAFNKFESAGIYSVELDAGAYKVMVIGPGGDGAKGGTSSANNYRPATRDDGATGGGGAWTSGQNGTNPTAAGRGINGQGGAGGIGGTGAVWLLKLEQLRKAQQKVR